MIFTCISKAFVFPWVTQWKAGQASGVSAATTMAASGVREHADADGASDDSRDADGVSNGADTSMRANVFRIMMMSAALNFLLKWPVRR